MSREGNAFDVKSCVISHFGPHRSMPGRVTGVVRVEIEEQFMGNLTRYTLDLKVRTDIGEASDAEIRTALLSHAAHQLNKLKSRLVEHMPVAAE
ncbi:hypothetical protein [Devosia epidermidihirudinis]|nr:hypothetical protein [Devosia epidermidihirudinis]